MFRNNILCTVIIICNLLITKIGTGTWLGNYIEQDCLLTLFPLLTSGYQIRSVFLPDPDTIIWNLISGSYLHYVDKKDFAWKLNQSFIRLVDKFKSWWILKFCLRMYCTLIKNLDLDMNSVFKKIHINIIGSARFTKRIFGLDFSARFILIHSAMCSLYRRSPTTTRWPGWRSSTAATSPSTSPRRTSSRTACVYCRECYQKVVILI